MRLLLLTVLLLLPLPASALSVPDTAGKDAPTGNIALDFGLASVIGIGTLLAYVKKEKHFMRKNTFRFERIKKKLREENYEN